jgi:(4S)-4-hydroxy-5-phosphonooxypentane-2,3-dione isomerase
MIVLVAKYRGTPGSGDVILISLQKMAQLVTEREPGCFLYQASRSTEDPDSFLLYEQYTDENALIAHRQTAHFKEIIEGTILPLLEERQREIYNLVVA